MTRAASVRLVPAQYRAEGGGQLCRPTGKAPTSLGPRTRGPAQPVCKCSVRIGLRFYLECGLCFRYET